MYYHFLLRVALNSQRNVFSFFLASIPENLMRSQSNEMESPGELTSNLYFLSLFVNLYVKGFILYKIMTFGFVFYEDSFEIHVF